MARKAKSKSGRRAKPLYFSSKISDYQFKRVVWHFVLDHSAAEAAKHVRLSANSISAIYAKLRKFSFDYGLLSDPFKGAVQRDQLPFEGFNDLVSKLHDFHTERLKQKRGSLHRHADEPDYHFAESFWRLSYGSFHDERGEEYAYRKMNATLLLFIQRFGPVGMKCAPTTADKIAGRMLALEPLGDATRWWRRNSMKIRKNKK